MREAAKIALLQPAKSVFLTEIDVVIIKIQIGSQTKPGFLPTKIHYPQFLVKLIVAIKQRCQLWLVRGDDYCYYYIYYYWPKEVWKSNFRQYGQMKSRDGKSQRRQEKKKEDQKEKVSEKRKSRCAKR